MPTSPAKPRLLMLTHRVPYPPDRGDRIRSYHLLRELAAHYDVSLASIADEPVTDAQRQALAALTVAQAIVPLSGWRSKLRALRALATGKPITPWLFREPALVDIVTKWQQDQPFDAVLTFCTGMAECARPVVDAGALHVLDLVDVDSIKWADYAKHAPPPMRWVYAAEANRLRQLESGRNLRFDAVTVISAAEADAYRQAVCEQPLLHVVGNGVDVDYFQPSPDVASPALVFVGVLDYLPNVQAMQWFVGQVMPLLRKTHPGVTLRIVGKRPTKAVQSLACDDVHVVGPVDDVRVELARACIAIAPLQLARGVQNKVLEAMAAGRAVVCTPAAAQGIDAADDEHLRIAGSPAEFASAVAELLTTDPVKRQRLAAAGRSRVVGHYAWPAAVKPMVELLGGARVGSAR